MKIKHIYWFAYYNTTEASVRYRAKFPLELLNDKYGVSYSIVYPGYDLKSIGNFIFTYFQALLFRKDNSLIVFQKIYTNRIYANALKVLLFFRNQNTWYDIDDAEYIRRPVETIQYFIRNCSVCSAGSKSLLNYIQPLNPNVFLLTSPVIEHRFVKKVKEEIFTLGWIGYYGAHKQSLIQLFFPALLKINFPINIIILGIKNKDEELEIKSYFENNQNISVNAPLDLNWLNEDTIYKTVSTFDLGISPLLDNEFNRCKSAFKLKQCLSCGIPVLGSSVGENPEFLQDGITGYLCNSPEEYYQKIVLFRNLSDENYTTFSLNARNALPKFSVSLYCSILLKYFENKPS